MRRKLLLPGMLAAVLAAAGCGESTVAPDDVTLSREDAALLAEELDALASAAIAGPLGGMGAQLSLAGGALAGAAPVPIHVTFTRTHACPKGGQVTVAGTITGEGDRETRTLVTEVSATKTQSACAFQTRRGVTITVNGNPNTAIRASRKVVNGAPSGLQTTTQKGSFTFSTSEGKSGSCEVDLTSTFDPETKTRTVKGTICGRTVDRTHTRG